MGPSKLPTMGVCTRGALGPREAPPHTSTLPSLAFLRALVASGGLWDPPHSARRVGGGLRDRSRASEQSCCRASNSNHPDPSVNPNLLTLTAPDKGGLTDLNLRGGLAFSPSLPGSPWPSLQVAPHLAVPAKCQHPSLP